MSGNAIKLLMTMLMVLDHIEYFIPPWLYTVFHVATRCVAPLFAYMAVEGFVYTRQRARYVLRLSLAAVFMYAGNAILNRLLFAGTVYTVDNNIFATLAACILCLYCFSAITRTRKWGINALLCVSGGLVVLMGVFFLEWGYVLIPLALITYYCKKKTALRNVLYFALSVAAFFLVDYKPLPSVRETLLHLSRQCQFLFITFLPFVYLYNGKRGSASVWAKYGFYLFYPLHIWVIHVIAYIVNAAG